MTVDYKDWVLSEQEEQRFQNWVTGINRVHTGTKDIRNQDIYWTPMDKPLSQAVVTVLTTAGVHLRPDTPFDVDSPHGDWSFREIPTGVATSNLAVTHTHYNHVDADRDINCMFPLDRLRELRDQGIIGGIGPTAYSMMGFNPDPTHLVEQTAPELARRIKNDAVDLVLMTCG